jgi:hypothetical protein
VNPISVSVERAAEMIGLSPTVLRSYIDSGLLPVIRFPSASAKGERSRRVLIAVSDLEKFVEQYRVAEPR